MKNIRKTTLLLAILISACLINRCTIIGMAVGSGVAKKQHEKRPILVPHPDSNIEFTTGEWLEVVKKDGKIVEGKYLEASYIAWAGTDSIPILMLQSIKLNILGRRSHETVMLNDIDHIIIGYKSHGSIVLGGAIGVTVDVTLFGIAIALVIESLFY